MAIYFVIIVVGLFNYKKYSHNLQLRLFLYFLIYSFFTEVAGAYIGRILIIKTHFIYNTWNIINILFYMLFFLSKIKHKNKRRYSIGLLFIFIISTLINIVFLKNYINQGLINNSILGSIFILFVIMIYYSELLNSDEILNIKKSLFFWISIGVLLFNIGIIPVYVIAEFISYRGVFKLIIFGLNILMSLSFIIGFLLSEKRYNY